MRKLLILSTFLSLLLSCSVKQKPEFIKLDNIEFNGTTSKMILLSAEAHFHNPNDIRGELKTDGLKVFVNDNELAEVISERFDVPARNEFSIPLRAHIPTDSLISNKNLSGLLGSLLSQKIQVQYKGRIKYKILGFSHYYDIDKTERITIDL